MRRWTRYLPLTTVAVATAAVAAAAPAQDLRAAFPRLGSKCRAKDHRQVPRPGSRWGTV